MRRLTNNQLSDLAPSWSPDGSQIVYQNSPGFKPHEILVINAADGSLLRQLTNNSVADYEPDWSPDGNRIAFVSIRDGYPEDVFVMDAANGGNVQRLTAGYSAVSPDWSPNGSRIAFAGFINGDYEIFVMDANGGNVQQLTDNSAADVSPAWSPDGRFIAFTSFRDSIAKTYLMNADGSNERRLSDGSATYDWNPTWSPEGTEIAFYSGGIAAEIRVMNLLTCPYPLRQLTGNTDDDLGPDWSPVGGPPVPFTPACDLPTPTPTPTPLPRIVAPEAQELHNHALEIGLPLPFDIMPVNESDLQWMQGYGPNTFTWTRSDYELWSTYRDTHGYHTGIDYGGRDFISIPVRAVCDGVILSGRTGSNGGSTKPNSGRGFVLRCLQDDPPLIDPDNDGHRNLSNIVVVYNHVIDSPTFGFPVVGDIVEEGEWLAQTTHYYSCSQADCTLTVDGTVCETTLSGGCDDLTRRWKQPNHLHLEVFIARGFRDGTRFGIGGDGNDSIRINPALMFTAAVAAAQEARYGPYYPIRKDYLFLGSVEVLETPPIDFSDTAAEGGEPRADQDFGIVEGDLTAFTPSGEIIRPETVGTNYRGLFWTRENLPIAGVQKIFIALPEWTTSTFPTSTSLLQHMFSTDTVYVPNAIYVGTAPYCTNVFLETGASLPDALCGGDGSVANDDADLDIG